MPDPKRTYTFRCRIKVAGVFLICLFFILTDTFFAASQQQPVKVSPGDIELAASLKAKEQELARREKELSKKEKEVAAMQADVASRLEELNKIQNEIQDKIDQIEEQKDVQFRNLVKVYTAMSSTKLAPLLNKMEDDTVARILRAMKTENVAKVMPKLESDKAVRVSRLLGMIE